MNKPFKPLKILQTPVRYPPHIGGVELVVKYLSEELVKMGHKVKVICANEPKGKRHEVVNGVEVERLPYYFKITNTNITLGLPWKLLTEDYDIVHTHIPTPWTSDLSAIIGKIRGKKVIVSIHNDLDKFGFFASLITYLYLQSAFRLTLYLADKIVIPNEHWNSSFLSTGQIISRYRRKVIVIPNGIDQTIFKIHKKVKRIPNSLIFVSILDRYHDFKGLNVLLDAMKIIKKRIPKIRLMVVGDGDARGEYEKYAFSMGLKDQVVFIGAKSQIEIAELFNKQTAFVLPSTDIEGFGTVALEALACGLYVIVTPMVAVHSLVNKFGLGEVVPVCNKTELAMAIERFFRRKSVTPGVQDVLSKFSWKSIAIKYQSLYMR